MYNIVFTDVHRCKMVSLINFVTGLLFCLAFHWRSSGEAKRTISINLNPDCPPDIDCAHAGLERYPNSTNALLHVVARPDDQSTVNQTVHLIFSTVGGPAILMILTDVEASIHVDWKRYLNATTRGESLVVRGNVYHSLGVMFSRIWKFNDGLDWVDADVPVPSNAIIPIPVEKLLWQNISIVNGTIVEASLGTSGDGNDGQLLGTNGTVRLSMEFFDSNGRSSSLPQLPHTDIGYQLDVELINLDMGNFSQPRLAIETVAVSQSAVTHDSLDYRLTEEDSIDDEYTPGVFRTYYLSTPFNDGFLMWKPVAYRDPSRSFDSFTRAKHGQTYPLANLSLLSLDMSNVISAYYGMQFPKHSIAFNMTFGLQKDKFYNNYRYLVWSLSAGWGEKPPETLSTLIIAILIISMAIPFLAVIVGVPCFIIKRRRARLPYENLIEDT